MVILAVRASSNSNDVGKNVGIVLGCLAVVIIMLPILSRSCNFFGRSSDEEPELAPVASTSRRRHLNAAEIMRLCALRDSTRPPREKSAKKSLLSPAEVELAAPKVSWARLVARDDRKESSCTASTIAVPHPVLIRDHVSSSPRSSEEAAAAAAAPHQAKDLPMSTETEQIGDDPTCSICLEGYEDDDVVRETVCHHVFHSCCLEQWLMKRRSHCPLCQGDLKLKREQV